MTTVQPRGDREKGMSPVSMMIASLDGGPYLTIGEVSESLGIPAATLRYWRDHKLTQAPSKEALFGRRKIYLYTQQDITELKAARPQGQPTIRSRRTAA